MTDIPDDAPEQEAKAELIRLSENPSTPPDTLAALASNDYWLVRTRVGRNPNTPGRVLARLAADPDSDVRRNVAGNTHTPVAILEVLASDRNGLVQQKAVCNPSMPMTTLERLHREGGPKLRKVVEAALSNRSQDNKGSATVPIIVDLDAVPPELIARLMGDLDAYHRALGGAGLTIRTIKVGSDAIEGAFV